MVFNWAWSDIRPAAFAAAYKRAQSGAWSPTPSEIQIADLRAIMGHTVLCLSALGGGVTFIGTTAHCKTDPTQFVFASADHEAIARAIAATAMIVAGPNARPKGETTVTRYEGGAETQGWPVVVGIIAVCVAVSAIAAAYISEDASQVIDRKLAREEDTKRLIKAQADAVDIVEKHVKAEAIKGGPLTWSDEEKNVINTLRATQAQITSKKELPLPTGNKGGGWFGGLLDGGLLTAALIFGGLWWLAQGKQPNAA